MNTDLRRKLKIIDTELLKRGYRLDIFSKTLIVMNDNAYNHLDSNTYVQGWFNVFAKYNRTNVPNYSRISFVVEPRRLSGASEHLTLDEAQEMVSEWQRMIKLCRHFDEMEIVATTYEICECMEDIKLKRKK